ncbi:MAG: methylenetetrahydrofolate reductase [NAD(P)H] [Calditrichales bacterium]|nr:MAG: methylenetetrahydrofolate reductase [NAD(P)H] [Calditrichales bacterium]
MKVIEHLAKAKQPLISFELIPPKRGGDIKSLLSVLDDLVKYKPPFIDITSHAAEVIYDETPAGIQKRIKRKRPGTLGICALIQNKYNVDAVPHVLCQGFTREETEDFLIEIQYLGIENVLAVRGDRSGYDKPLQHGRTANNFAVDLVKQINDMNKGTYLEENLLDAQASDFCIGVGGYPEKHFESPNMKTDIMHLKKKIEAGAQYVVTQMFYDNQVYYKFVEACRAEGITIPIIPGLKILLSKGNLTTLPRNFYVNIPEILADEIQEADAKHTFEIGVNWAAKQVEDLLAHNVPAIHFYIMQNSKPINTLMKKLNF